MFQNQQQNLAMFSTKRINSQISDYFYLQQIKPFARFNFGFCSLSEFEMFQIRGGAEVPKPKTKPRDVFDEKLASLMNQSTSSTNESDILSVLLNWLKK